MVSALPIQLANRASYIENVLAQHEIHWPRASGPAVKSNLGLQIRTFQDCNAVYRVYHACIIFLLFFVVVIIFLILHEFCVLTCDILGIGLL